MSTATSIRQKLLNISREKRIEFQLLLTRYALERFLYRLSISPHKESFILKGAMLFPVWNDSLQRPTRDLDLLSFGNPETTIYATIINDIWQQTVNDDGLAYQADSLVVEQLKPDEEYRGLRARFLAKLDSAKIPIQIDIGFGDSVHPNPELITYPTLLDSPAPELRAYPKETVVAEKFQAMVVLGIANSRMKDFYDLWSLCTAFEFESAPLTTALHGTFDRRQTPLPVEPPLAFTSTFFDNPSKQTQWKAFLRKSRLGDTTLELKEVTEILRSFIMPMLNSKELQNFESWSPADRTWS